ncbi:MAG: LysR family transcriptional regulator [Pseudomonadota bacterium]
MNIDHIRTFLEIAATGSFNRAAEQLNITQSTASARIKALEDRLGQALFSRGRNGVIMTGPGDRFHRYAVTAVRAWEQARQDVSLPTGFKATLGLGAQVSLWERLVIAWMAWMRAQVPEVALRLEADYSQSQMRHLADGLLDIGVMYQPRNTPGLVIEKLLEEQLVLVSSDRRNLSQGWVEDYVFVDWGDEFRAAHARAFPQMKATAISVGLGAVGLQYVLKHGGSGYFPKRVVRPHIESERLHLVPQSPVIARPAYVVYSGEPDDPTLLETALKGLRQIAAQELDM